MWSRSSGLMRMQVSESVSLKIWGEEHRERCVPNAPSSSAFSRAVGSSVELEVGMWGRLSPSPAGR